jgi:DNA repair photolyase
MTDYDDSDLRAHTAVRGRGTGELSKGRFERLEVAYVPQKAQQVRTELFKDTSRSILAFNDSPDVGFSATLNPYRGCEHGCIYCYARPTHEYLGLSCGLDFETKIFAKMEAASLLGEALQAKSWQPQAIGLSGVTDCYQPMEKDLRLTRQCLEVLTEFRNPVVVITKNHLVTRDIDVLQELAQHQCAHVVLSITTLDPALARHMEPRASQPRLRLEAVEQLSKAGIPVSVNMAPIIPGLTDHEIPELLKRAADAGAESAGYVLVRLPYGVKDLFQTWLDEHYPLRKQKILNRIREIRNGQLNSAQFGNRMTGEGIYAEHIAQLFAQSVKRYGLDRKSSSLSTAHFRRRPDAQLTLF